jgi:hypothetical protein
MIFLMGFALFALMHIAMKMGPMALGAALSFLPHHGITPGSIDSRVTQANIQSTICKPGWTKTVRPPENYTNKLKLQLLPKYGHNTDKPLNFELDHLVPLEIGGHPTDPNNLWPQAYAGTLGARRKDVLERKLNRMVCAGTITLAQAQRDVSTDWVVAYKQYVSTTTRSVYHARRTHKTVVK